MREIKTGCSSVWSESSVWNRDAAGSNPATQTNNARVVELVYTAGLDPAAWNMAWGFKSLHEYQQRKKTGNCGFFSDLADNLEGSVQGVNEFEHSVGG